MERLSRLDVLRGLTGAWQLARGDRSALAWFDLSVEGFWRSFWAPILALPGYVLLSADQAMRSSLPYGLGLAFLGEGLSFLLGIVAFPLAALFLSRFLGLGNRYVPLVVAYNWAGLLQIGAYVAALLLGSLIPPLKLSLLTTATLVSLVYEWFVLRTALETTGGIAFAFLLIDLILGVLIGRGFDFLQG